MPIWTLVGLVVAAWFVLAVVVGLALGAVIRHRDQRTAGDRRSQETGPDERA